MGRVTVIDLQKSADKKTLADHLATRIGQILETAITEKGRASLAVSGGSTPVALFEELSTRDIAWQKICITLVDERWVEPEEDASNEHLVRTHLLKNHASSASFTGMKTRAATAGQGVAECQRRLADVPRPFDALILGMGDDGHTASLFPGAEKLAQATDLQTTAACMAIAPLTAPHERMTLTLRAILDSCQVFLLITGQKKFDVLQKALQDGPADEMPIRYILRQRQTPLTVYWAP